MLFGLCQTAHLCLYKARVFGPGFCIFEGYNIVILIAWPFWGVMGLALTSRHSMEYNSPWSPKTAEAETFLLLLDFICMIVSLKGTEIEIAESIREYFDEKITRLVEKLFLKNDELLKLNLEAERTTRHHRHGKIFRAEANLSIGKVLLRAEALGENLHEAIDLLEEELRREIKKFKTKRTALERQGARLLKSKR